MQLQPVCREAVAAAVLVLAVLHPRAQHTAAEETADRLVAELRTFPTPIPTTRAAQAGEEQRWRVIRALRELGSPAVRALARAMSHSDVSMRRNAVIALHRLASGIDAKGRVTKVDIRDSVPALINALRDDGDTSVRAWSAQALGSLQPPPAEALPILLAALGDPSTGVRLSACGAIGTVGPVASAAGPELTRRFGDPSQDMRRCARFVFDKISR